MSHSSQPVDYSGEGVKSFACTLSTLRPASLPAGYYHTFNSFIIKKLIHQYPGKYIRNILVHNIYSDPHDQIVEVTQPREVKYTLTNCIPLSQMLADIRDINAVLNTKKISLKEMGYKPFIGVPGHLAFIETVFKARWTLPAVEVNLDVSFCLPYEEERYNIKNEYIERVFDFDPYNPPIRPEDSGPAEEYIHQHIYLKNHTRYLKLKDKPVSLSEKAINYLVQYWQLSDTDICAWCQARDRAEADPAEADRIIVRDFLTLPPPKLRREDYLIPYKRLEMPEKDTQPEELREYKKFIQGTEWTESTVKFQDRYVFIGYSDLWRIAPNLEHGKEAQPGYLKGVRGTNFPDINAVIKFYDRGILKGEYRSHFTDIYKPTIIDEYKTEYESIFTDREREIIKRAPNYIPDYYLAYSVETHKKTCGDKFSNRRPLVRAEAEEPEIIEDENTEEVRAIEQGSPMEQAVKRNFSDYGASTYDYGAPEPEPKIAPDHELMNPHNLKELGPAKIGKGHGHQISPRDEFGTQNVPRVSQQIPLCWDNGSGIRRWENKSVGTCLLPKSAQWADVPTDRPGYGTHPKCSIKSNKWPLKGLVAVWETRLGCPFPPRSRRTARSRANRRIDWARAYAQYLQMYWELAEGQPLFQRISDMDHNLARNIVRSDFDRFFKPMERKQFDRLIKKTVQ